MKPVKPFHKACAVLLAVMLASSFAACGDSGTIPSSQGAGSPTASESKADPSSEEQPAAQDGPWAKYDTPVTLTRAQQISSATQWPDGDSPEDNVWIRDALDTFNIKLEDYWSVDNSQYAQKINVSIASNDLPDVFTVDSAQLQQLIKSGMIADLTDVYEANASDQLRAVMDADSVGFESGKSNGRLMALSQQHFGVISMFNSLWIRQDWMDALGLEAPQTMADLENICYRFVHDDPDGNGVDDTYGLGVDKWIYQLYYLMAGFDAYPLSWLRDANDQIVFGGVQPEVKNALGTFQKWYQNGILNKEFGIEDGAKLTEDLVSGKVGVYVQRSWFGFSPGIDVVKRNGEEAIFMPYAIPSVEGGAAKAGLDWPVNSYTVVSKNCKNPEAVIRMMNLYVDRTSKDYATYMDGDIGWGASPFTVNNPMADYNQFVNISEAENTRDTSKLTPDQLGKYNNVIKWIDEKDPDAVGAYCQVSSAGAYSVFKPMVDSHNYVMTEYRGVATPTMTQKQSSLDTLYAEEITKIIMGAPLDDFDKLVEKWNTLGGSDITKEMNEMLNP